MSFIAGQYTATLNANSLGQIEAGITLEHRFFKRLITGDNMAETPQDGIFRGGELFVAYNLLEYNAAGASAAFWPYGAGYLNMSTVIGTLDTASALQLVLTALAGTPAAATPATITLPDCVLAEGYPVGILFAPDLRTVPIRQRVYPNSSKVFGTTT